MLEQEELKKRLAILSPEKHNALVNLLRKQGIADSQLPITARGQASNKFPLSYAQLGLWSLQQLDPDSSVYNLPIVMRLTGLLNVAALEQSLGEIVLRHEILRTTFPSIDGQPIQLISSDVPVKLPVVNLRKLSEFEPEGEAQRLAIEQLEQPFDLAQEPPWRFKLLKLAEEEYLLVLTIHHIIFDGKSLNNFFRELAALYRAFSTKQPSPLSELSIQYADFACWQQQWLQSKELESQFAYWQQKLGGSVPALELPIDRLRPTVLTYQGLRQSLVLPKNLTNDLKMLSLQEGATLFMTLLAAFKTLLYCYTKQEDILLASPVTGHDRSETEALIGYFNNILLMRTDLSGNPSFRELIGRVRKNALEAYQNQNVPLQKLGEMPNLARTPLSRGMFALHHLTSQPLELPGLTVSFPDIHNRTANFDLSLLMEEKEETLTALLEYKTTLFNSTTITQMLENFQTLLESLVANSNQQLSDLPLLRDPESHSSLNKTKQDSEQAFVAPRDELELQLTKIWERVLGIQSISIKADFFGLGGQSLQAVNVFTEIERNFGKNLPLSILFQTATVEEIANIIRRKKWQGYSNSLVEIQPNGSKPPFFCIHEADGHVLCYRDLANYLGSDQPFYGLQPQHIDGKRGFHTWIEDAVGHYIKEIRTIQPEGPYLLGGLCMGGILAFEIAQQLQAQGQKVALLALFDAAITSSKRPPQRHLKQLLQLGFREKLTYILKIVKGRTARWFKPIKAKSKLVTYRIYLNNERFFPQVSYKIPVREAFHASWKYYIPKAYQGRVTLFRVDDGLAKRFGKESLFGWDELASDGVEVYDVPGHHGNADNPVSTFLQEPYVQVLAAKLKDCIDKAQTND